MGVEDREQPVLDTMTRVDVPFTQNQVTLTHATVSKNYNSQVLYVPDPRAELERQRQLMVDQDATLDVLAQSVIG